MRLAVPWDFRPAARRRRRARAAHSAFDPLEKARRYLDALKRKPGLSSGDLAGRFGVTHTEVCNYVTVARRLAPDLAGQG